MLVIKLNYYIACNPNKLYRILIMSNYETNYISLVLELYYITLKTKYFIILGEL